MARAGASPSHFSAAQPYNTLRTARTQSHAARWGAWSPNRAMPNASISRNPRSFVWWSVANCSAASRRTAGSDSLRTMLRRVAIDNLRSGACKTRKPRETSIAAPVVCNALVRLRSFVRPALGLTAMITTGPGRLRFASLCYAGVHGAHLVSTYSHAGKAGGAADGQPAVRPETRGTALRAVLRGAGPPAGERTIRPARAAPEGKPVPTEGSANIDGRPA